MKTSLLKKLLLGIWGGILLLAASLAIWVFSSGSLSLFLPDYPQPFSENRGTPPPSAIPATSTRPASPVPTETATPRPTLFFPTSTTVPPIGMPGPIYVEVSLPPHVNPLTGLPVEDLSRLDRRPVAVKIANYPRFTRVNQSGLLNADVVYEYYIENGMTRFVAVYYGQDAEKAGPVRSGRYFDEHVMRMYHSALVFANADERVEKHLLESDLRPLLFVRRADNCPPLCPDSSIKHYNNLFVNTAGVGPLLSSNEKQEIRATFFYSAPTTTSTAQATRIEVNYSEYSYFYWEYNYQTKTYLRYSDAADARDERPRAYSPHMDALTGRQVETTNLVVLVVPHLFNNQFDREDQVFNINLTGEGPAYVFRDGVLFPGKWIRDKIEQPIRLVDPAGNSLPLSQGTTFYTVINPESEIRQEGAILQFNFWIPPRFFTPTPTP